MSILRFLYIVLFLALFVLKPMSKVQVQYSLHFHIVQYLCLFSFPNSYK
jgi:hypothetical protein